MATRALPYESELPAPSPRHASLWPREHGSYVQLLAPLLAALLVVPPTVAGVLMAIAACAAFLGTEAVVIAKGGRGTRRQRADGDRAVRRARACATIVIATGCLGLLIAPRPAVELAALVALPAAFSLLLATRRSIHSLGGELLAAVTLAGAAAPVAAASGMARADALVLWLAWSLGFTASVVAVHAVLARHRKRARHWLEPTTVLGLAGAVALVIWAPRLAVALPLIVAGIAVGVIAPSAKRLTAVGIALACAAAASVAVAVAL